MGYFEEIQTKGNQIIEEKGLTQTDIDVIVEMKLCQNVDKILENIT